jgi:hypothetical protein
MSWSGSWNNNRTGFTGTYTAPDGTVYTGTWILPPALHLSDPPGDPLSSDDPFFLGAPTDDSIREDHKKRWSGSWDGRVWTGEYKAPGGIFDFTGTMTPPHA